MLCLRWFPAAVPWWRVSHTIVNVVSQVVPCCCPTVACVLMLCLRWFPAAVPWWRVSHNMLCLRWFPAAVPWWRVSHTIGNHTIVNVVSQVVPCCCPTIVNGGVCLIPLLMLCLRWFPAAVPWWRVSHTIVNVVSQVVPCCCPTVACVSYHC